MIEKFVSLESMGAQWGSVYTHIHSRTMEKVASAYVPEGLMSVIESIKPRPEGRYVLINALGAYEIWGSNANGDAFPEWGLKSLPPPKDVITLIDTKVKEKLPDFCIPTTGSYGAPTFTTTAKVYVNHVNKDPLIACGDVIAQAYNDRMHRVELILFVYKDRAPDIVQMIDDGAAIPWSMGARLKFDVCGVCSNIARSRSEYCPHLATQLRQVLPDGRKVFSYNYFPVFFDISKVGVPADKSAWMLRKVASAGVAKQATIEKREVVKEKPANLGPAPVDPRLLSFIQSKAPQALCDENSLPDPQLRNLAKTHGPGELLRTMLMLGMLPTAKEVDVIADKNPENIPDKLDLVNPNRKLIVILGPSVPDRSLLDPHFSKRAFRNNKVSRLTKSACSHKFAEVLSRVDFNALTHMLETNPTIRLTVDSTALESSLIKSAETRSPVWLPFIVCSHFLRSNYLC